MKTLKWIADNKEWLFSGIGPYIIGAILTSLGAVFLFLRRKRQAPRRILKNLERSMGDLFSAMRADLRDYPLVREFFVVPFKHARLGFVTRYNADEIPDLIGKVHILEGYGFVHDVTPGDTPVYRMSEEFVKYLSRTLTHRLVESLQRHECFRRS